MTADRTQTRRRWWVGALALAAGLRVLLGAACLPFFTNVDEWAHFDLVYKYARGYRPQRDSQRYSEGSIPYLALYWSPEYFKPRGNAPPGAVPPPLFERPRAVQEAAVAAALSDPPRFNHEAYSPPVYYLLAGGWFNLGEWLGVRGGSLLYWVRFLNAPLYAGLIVGAYVFCRRFYPGRPAAAWAVPVLVAFFPQDVFYTINSDVVSPALFLTAFGLLLEWDRRERAPAWLGAAAGLSTAAVVLVKYSNVAILAVFGLVWVRRLTRRDGAPAALGAVALALPLGVWFFHNQMELGDAFGTALKTQQLHWSPKPLSEIFDHPLFTPGGLGYFATELVERYWRGEIVWHLRVLALAPADWFFVAATALALCAAALRRFARGSRVPEPERRADTLCWLALAASVGLLVALSLRYDFGDCPYPSRERPYFVSGRLLIGTLVPFLVLFVSGLEFLAERCGKLSAGPAEARRCERFGAAAGVGLAVVAMLVSRAEFLRAAARSRYNWFHLP
jgi:hypothetical protein